jgi:predicted NBD/HSP70 family sugar kinase
MVRLKVSPSSKSESNKRNMLLQALHRRGPSSRLHLARALHISNSRVCDLVDRMLEQKLLLEDALGGDRRGRRGVSLGLNPGYGQLVGFDMEAKRLRLVATNFAGEVLWQDRATLRPPKDRQALVDTILSFIDTGLKEVRRRFGRPIGFGIAASGVIDAKRGTILHYDLLPHAVDLPIRELIARQVDLPCVMENNIRAMTLAEWCGGAAKGLNTFICMAVRSGVGAGVVLNGRLRGGAHGFCGETGYMVVPTGGPSAQWKQLQQVVSETALGIDAEAEGFDVSDATARRCGELLGAQLASMSALIDPEAFVLAGGLLQTTGRVWPHVVESFRRLALRELAERVHLLPAQLGAFAAAQGAAHRAMYELFPVAPTVA